MPFSRRFFTENGTVSQERTSALRQQLLWMLLLRVVLYTALLGITYLLNELDFSIILLPKPALILLLLLIYLSSISSAFILTRFEVDIRKFGLSQSLLDTIFACCLIYMTGISNSIFASVFFFPIITGGLIMPRRGGLLAASAATLSYGVILLLEYEGVTPNYFTSFDFTPMPTPVEFINLFAVKGLTFFLAALLSEMFGKRLTSAEAELSDTIEHLDRLSLLYKTIFDNISTGIITTDDNNIITSINNAALSITGYRLYDCLGKDLQTIFPCVDPGNKITRQAVDFTRTDGTTIRIGYSSTHLPSTETSAAPDSSSDNQKGRRLFTLQDISEIEKMEQKLRQGEKMAAIGMMSAGIAHDFRNPLTAISGSAQVLANEFASSSSPSSTENLALARIILRESSRLTTTISDFLVFARPDTVEREWFSLQNCLEEVLEVCRAQPKWPASLTLHSDIDQRLDIWADRKQFFTVMNHLLNNAIEFCPENEEIIRIHAEEVKEADNKEMLRIEVEDNGSGIEPDKYAKIFEPFYTNRADGTGLGLAIVNQIVEGHKGSIDISRSELGGARFTIVLPYYY